MDSNVKLIILLIGLFLRNGLCQLHEGPDPPANLSVVVSSEKTAIINWNPPLQGSFSNFKLKINALTPALNSNPQIPTIENLEGLSYVLRELTPGATYQVQAFTVFEGKESAAASSTNFTTRPNTPGTCIIWFRNETTLLILWQPPNPASIYSHYKVFIDPPDAIDSILYVAKEGEPPEPAQAAFKGLFPGRVYNISVQTMSEDETSTPTIVQVRTLPLRPLNVTVDMYSVTSTSFSVYWEAPNGRSEFDKYQIYLGSQRKQSHVIRLREEPLNWEFKDLEPGKTYQVIVKTVSGKVVSWPASADVTLKPMSVIDLHAEWDENLSGVVKIAWSANANSHLDGYLISYHEVGSPRGDGNTVSTNQTEVLLDTLLPGRNYLIAIQAVSEKVKSEENFVYFVTRPSAPIT